LLVTTGCGISQSSWAKWPTWPKYCNMVCDHINLGAPAVGNHYIALSLLKYVSQVKPDCIIITWTSYNKLDIFVEDAELAENIHNYPSRNFLVNWNGSVVSGPNAWWPSSVSNDNPIKHAYAKQASDKFHALTTLQSVLLIQQHCKTNSIPLYQYMSYEWPLEEWSRDTDINWLYNMIDWTAFEQKSLANDYYHSRWIKYQHNEQYGLIPTAGWHAEFFKSDILPILVKHFNIRPIKIDNLIDAARILSKKLYDENTDNTKQE